MVALFRRRPDQAPEASENRGAGDAELPIHPFVRECAFAQIGRLEHRGFVLGGEITNDGVRFPEQKAVIFFERRHQPVRVHGEISWLAVLAELSADIDALMRQTELADRPHDLLHIRRSVTAPDFDHDSAPSSISSWLTHRYPERRGCP